MKCGTAMPGDPRQYFALQHTSGIFMPQFEGRAGGTHIDPFYAVHQRMPVRLFTTELAASNALKWWAKGAVSRKESSMDDFYGEGYCEETIDPKPNRIAAEWTVVPVKVNTNHVERYIENGKA